METFAPELEKKIQFLLQIGRVEAPPPVLVR